MVETMRGLRKTLSLAPSRSGASRILPSGPRRKGNLDTAHIQVCHVAGSALLQQKLNLNSLGRRSG